MEVVTEQEATPVLEPISLNDEPKKLESLDWTDNEEEEEKAEEAEVERKDRGRKPVTRGKNKATFEKAMEENKRKKKERQGFILIDDSDVEEVNLVSGDEEDEEEEEELPLQGKGKKKAESSAATPKGKCAKKRKLQSLMIKGKGTSSKRRKETQRKIAIVGREEWFAGLMMLKGRVIDPAMMTMFGIKELLEKMKVHGWTHLFLFSLPIMYGEAMLHFYMNFKLLENDQVSIKVREVNLVLDAKILGEILNVPTEVFDTYVRHEWPELGGKG
ncbi:hypothetical protein A4A49_21302 [Nicotiana attenuata]|uniref:Uncharacterized protein n=1 Tax=Nicotiana attenuata TaxID=49451 RepID=A0A1J6KFT1_NICAT|nr:hypothetical protein A4A49_21302 [Nicotiana attenuata]